MYPIGRMMKEMVLQRRASKIGLLDVHRSSHRCWPWDLDPWMELNNGRTLTLYDLGRLPMMLRNGLVHLLRKSGCGLTVAGASVRYRQRIRAFQRFDMLTRIIGWDERFFYMEQGIWLQERCANHILLRLAVTKPKPATNNSADSMAGNAKAGGIVPPVTLLAYSDELAIGDVPELPGWVKHWIESEANRPWPPTRHE